MNEIVMQT